MFNNRLSRRKHCVLFTLASVWLTALVGCLLMHRLDTNSAQAIQHRVDAWRTVSTMIRWGLIALIFFCWNQFVAWWARVSGQDKGTIGHLQRLRWRTVTWLVVVELVLGQGVLTKTMALAIGILR